MGRKLFSNGASVVVVYNFYAYITNLYTIINHCINFTIILRMFQLFRKSQSVHGSASQGNLYQKMHFAGSNLSTDPKCPKCIYKISKNFRVEKSGEISRNLRFSRFFVPASKSDTHHGYGLQKRSYRQFCV